VGVLALGRCWHEFAIEFRWFERADIADIADIADTDLRPASLQQLLTEPLPEGVPTIVNVI